MEIQKDLPRPMDDAYRILILADPSKFLNILTDACQRLGHEVVPLNYPALN